MVSYFTKTRVAVVQAAPIWLDADATVDKTIRLMGEAGREGAKLIGFPESWIPGYPHFLWTETNSEWPSRFVKRYYENSLEISSPQIRRIQQAAMDHEVSVVLGLSERNAGSLYISQVVIDETGRIQGLRRKFKPTHAERGLFGEGDGSDILTFDLPGVGRVGALSCWEHMQPLLKYTMNGLGEQIHVASWPAVTQPYYQPFTAEAYETINRMYAMENQCFVLCSTAIFDHAGSTLMADTDAKRQLAHLHGGTSRIYGPDGTELATPLAPSEEGVLYADIDLSDILTAKNVIDQVGHYSRPSIFRLHVDKSSPKSFEFSGTQGPRDSLDLPVQLGDYPGAPAEQKAFHEFPSIDLQ
ncbi:carbon-nitrogen hydrolase family protein [Paenarthrobacter sp. NPDC057981]|uniref:carbon-nitrogen hydrolase family protein n=1 Tax=Paenarthrobacter sp. NPDC057981 TaxID=3346297 RepID=UPI0036D96EF4